MMGRQRYHYEVTESTNLQATQLAEQGAPHGTLVTADCQSAGRGRRGRSWESVPGESICMTLILRPEFEPERASALTLVMALAVARALQEFCDGEVRIKWPNDIVLNRKKVCGILTELHMQLPGAKENDTQAVIRDVIIGVGINVNQDIFSEEIRDIATSLRLECRKVYSRAEIIECVIRYFEQYYEQYLQTLDLSLMQEAYNELLINRESQVRVLDPKGEYNGTAHGITAEGELLVEREDGTVTQVYAGEVSVRGLYGYAQ